MSPLSILMRLLLFVTVVSPSLAMGLFGTSSMAAGSLVVSLLYISIFIAVGGYAWPRVSLAPWVVVMFFGTAILYLHSAYSFYMNNEFDFDRFWQSHLLLCIYSLGANCLAILSRRMSPEQADGSINFVFWVLILSAIAGMVRFSPFFPVEAFKSVLFYGEPSHFALDFLPLLLYEIVRSRSWRKLALLLGGLIICLMLENLTLLVGVALIFCMTVPLRLLILLLPVATLMLLVTDLEYYAKRLDFSGSSSNLSTLAYLQGLERAYLNLIETNGLGVGFQQFGIVGSKGDVLNIIKALIGSEINLYDGGSIAQKFIGEFGMMGILLILLYLAYFVRSVKWLSKESVSNGVQADPRNVFFHSCFVMYAIDLTIRGVGYFSSSGFLFVASLCWLFLTPHGSVRSVRATVSSHTASEPLLK